MPHFFTHTSFALNSAEQLAKLDVVVGAAQILTVNAKVVGA